VLLALAVLLAGVFAAGIALRQSEDKMAERQAAWLQRAGSGLQTQIDQAKSALLGARGLFAAADHLDETRFARFAAPSLGRGGLSALIWAPYVPGVDRTRYERTTGRRVQSIVNIPNPRLGRAERKRFYYPLTFLAPLPPTARPLLGVDLSEIPGVSASLAAAARSGQIIVAPPFTVVPGSSGLILLAPIYRHAATGTPG
jgi:CHASE1-domain containing sensor protein